MLTTASLKLLTNTQTAELLGLRSNTLEIWRTQGKGPVYRKIGRAVRYAEADVLSWLDAQTRTSTSQQPGQLTSV
ncbi:helix-turn-helix transcriptional regulator [Cupriavidus plantarum]|uniref:helix-turn-helix transcriptional regulator n=1 Tax=Cupriavidus plantarum TaxID=942865 RepID=UPI000EB4837C|nr:helix-turn-helix domain-containing protein [Cupriavidus plantarum]RLK44531.1 AlpA family transcriptional regulator [Cupriavidus plantarum]